MCVLAYLHTFITFFACHNLNQPLAPSAGTHAVEDDEIGLTNQFSVFKYFRIRSVTIALSVQPSALFNLFSSSMSKKKDRDKAIHFSCYVSFPPLSLAPGKYLSKQYTSLAKRPLILDFPLCFFFLSHLHPTTTDRDRAALFPGYQSPFHRIVECICSGSQYES